MKLLLNIALLAALVGLGYWAYIELLAGETTFGSRRHPVAVIAACFFFSTYLIIDTILIAIKPWVKKHPKLYTRLYSGFWNFLLGPEKSREET